MVIYGRLVLLSGVVGGLVTLAPVRAGTQVGRAVDGQLAPFATLEGVRLLVSGPGGGTFNVIGETGGESPEKFMTGFSPEEASRMQETLTKEAMQALSGCGVRILPGLGQRETDTQPKLWVSAVTDRRSMEVSDNPEFTVEAEAKLLEAARLVRSPSTIVWSPSWQQREQLVAPRSSLERIVSELVASSLAKFCDGYKRAREH